MSQGKYNYTSISIKKSTKQELNDVKDALRHNRREEIKYMNWDDFFKAEVIPALKGEKEGGF